MVLCACIIGMLDGRLGNQPLGFHVSLGRNELTPVVPAITTKLIDVLT